MVTCELTVKKHEKEEILYNTLIKEGINENDIDRLVCNGRVDYFLIKNTDETYVKLLDTLKKKQYFTDLILFFAYDYFLIIL